MTITDIENVATAAAQPSVPRRIRLKRPTWFGGAVGICGLIALWWILAAAGVIKGRRISAYPACSPEVELAGATYASISVDAAVTDGLFVTAPAWPAHPAWIAQFLTVLGTRIEHTSLAAV